jgi:hypothetical protein
MGGKRLMAAKPIGKAYLYTEDFDHRVGMVVFASEALSTLGFRGGSSVIGGSTDISDRAAAFLGISRSSSIVVADRKWKLAPGVKLLENREAGAYLWNRSHPDDEVDVQTRLPGWRLKIEYTGGLVARGLKDAPKLPAWAQLVLQP